ncbi:tRNA (adenosine(37)-N6)-threonylcarbamoyltransferase complex ATPase subunit type 1 TsaE [Candidatus Peribacteria bacterium RIFCSPLOWO2_01_FULL_51_18]|nr:MAG: tRNA (adenosine(37)-N6)-threonylcarbamoyltransferase complex ATPase subunit type 1 TsaE [Candidatus Peribacteria bacterium RIFCSPHIGHO2_02_FULL_51_15]OGJ65184.1 MAG: tRNA (adenosine(37)-N6)-threonylcarbamoyltransferase complex ATPase subunit type 1 TsaE [Candidatus Peribacteria bacterium RIFCSPLOWO2_01_FULL_51_18]OGJ67252.1 MAG: tRNA (adenosine(37)-N6)-threonylcarbamoyltransferase complex ATPase subunit type 1 TsaE [Candidatus Peribacteria bacterium RIFCSPLOWO2_02_FULL_51_10]
MIDECELSSKNSLETTKTGSSLAGSFYKFPVLISLSGPLGAGKTVFVKGLGSGLGLKSPSVVTSPTFALEQRYENKLLHIDFYRLKKNQTAEILHQSEDFPGIRIVEWADRAGGDIDEDIRINIEEMPDDNERRKILISFLDMKLPTQKEIAGWRKEVLLPEHIVRHNDMVAEVCERLIPYLNKNGMVIRKQATIAAARTHDLLRFIDFKSSRNNWDDFTGKQRVLWKKLKDRFTGSHESAAADFVSEKGYPEIGKIIMTHRGYSDESEKIPKTNEQILLSYSDKRVLEDKIVTLEERFAYFSRHYAGGKETPFAQNWYKDMRAAEKKLFPEKVPF